MELLFVFAWRELRGSPVERFLMLASVGVLLNVSQQTELGEAAGMEASEPGIAVGHLGARRLNASNVMPAPKFRTGLRSRKGRFRNENLLVRPGPHRARY